MNSINSINSIRIATSLAASLLLLGQPCRAQEVRKFERLGGHLRIYHGDAIYTPIYECRNFENSRRIKLVFVHHVGLPPYFDELKNHLANCDTVIYEDSPSAMLTPDEKMLASARKPLEIKNKTLTEHQWVDQASRSKPKLFQDYVISMQASYVLCAKCINCQFEGDAFKEERKKEHWISGDAKYFEQLEDSKIQRVNRMRISQLLKKTDRIEGIRLAKRVWDLKAQGRLASDVSEGGIAEFWPYNFAAVPFNAYDAQPAFRIYYEMYLQPMAEAMIKTVFDPIEQAESRPPLIGLKYGVEHAEYVLELLKERGYEIEETTWITNMKLNQHLANTQ